MSNKYRPALLTALLVAICVNAPASGTTRTRNVTFLCHIETIEHLNCGGGLRAPDALPPDCTNFVAERVTGTRTSKISVPNDHLTFKDGKVEFVHPFFVPRSDSFLRSDEGKVMYESSPRLYTDAAGYSVKRGTCSIMSDNARVRRIKAHSR
jgi:hypothetical protein